MVKIKIDNVNEDLLNITWRSRTHFYSVLSIVKKYIGSHRVGKIWKMHKEDMNSFIDDVLSLDKMGEVETIHIDKNVIKSYQSFFIKNKQILNLRNSLDGIDSGIRLRESELLPFQHIGVEFAFKLKNCLIADKVGLGKTLQGLCAAYKMWQNREIDKCIIVLSSSLKEKWSRDIKYFLGQNSTMLDGVFNLRKKNYKKWLNNDAELYSIITYDTLRRDLVNTIKSKYGREFVINEESYLLDNNGRKFCVIMDELQKIKNISAGRSKACRFLCDNKFCISRIGLSATYVETGLENLFGIMYVIDENVFGRSWSRFQYNFIVLSFMGKIEDYKNVEYAADKMKYKSVRRNREMVKDQMKASLPKIVENTLWLDMNSDQKKITKQILVKAVEVIKDMEKSDRINMANAMTEMGYLRQAALSAELIDPDIKSSIKIDILVNEFLPEVIEDNKILIFCFYTKFVDILERELKRNNINCIAMHNKRIEGKVKNRQNIIDEFSNNKDIPILISSDILKEGIDVPAASYVVNTDILWNPAGMIQRCGRIDRLNQESSTIYNVNIWCRESIESAMHEVVYKRMELANQIIDGGIVEKRHHRLSFSDIKTMLRKAGGKF